MHIRSGVHIIVLVLVTSTIHAAQLNSPETGPGYYACFLISSPQKLGEKEHTSEENLELTEAADNGDVEGVKKSIEEGASPNACSPGGTSALCCAVNCSNKEEAARIVAILLEKGARPCDLFKFLAQCNGIKFTLPQAAKSTGTT